MTATANSSVTSRRTATVPIKPSTIASMTRTFAFQLQPDKHERKDETHNHEAASCLAAAVLINHDREHALVYADRQDAER